MSTKPDAVYGPLRRIALFSIVLWLFFLAGFFVGVRSESRRVAHGTCGEFLQ